MLISYHIVKHVTLQLTSFDVIIFKQNDFQQAFPNQLQLEFRYSILNTAYGSQLYCMLSLMTVMSFNTVNKLFHILSYKKFSIDYLTRERRIVDSRTLSSECHRRSAIGFLGSPWSFNNVRNT